MLLIPYIFLYLLPELIYKLIIIPQFGQETHSITIDGDILPFLESLLTYVFWFIPVLFLYFLINYFISSRILNKSFVISIFILLFYSFIIHYGFTTNTSHTFAVFGYLFFFFLGRIYFLNHKKVDVKLWMLIIAFLFSYFEFIMLNNNANTLKISNIIYSLILFFFLEKNTQKFRLSAFLGKVNFYFVYLFHSKVIYIISLFFYIYGYSEYLNPTTSFLSTIILIPIVLFFCLLTERIIFGSNNLISRLFKSK